MLKSCAVHEMEATTRERLAVRESRRMLRRWRRELKELRRREADEKGNAVS